MYPLIPVFQSEQISAEAEAHIKDAHQILKALQAKFGEHESETSKSTRVPLVAPFATEPALSGAKGVGLLNFEF